MNCFRNLTLVKYEFMFITNKFSLFHASFNTMFYHFLEFTSNFLENVLKNLSKNKFLENVFLKAKYWI